MGDKMVYTMGVGENVLSKLNEENVPDKDSCELPDQQIVHFIISNDVTEKSYLSDNKQEARDLKLLEAVFSHNSSDEAQMFILYQDIFVCGTCQRQFMDIIGFLQHKAEHALNRNWYWCELCSRAIASSAALLLHYRKQHKLPLISVSSPAEPCDEYQQRNGGKQCVIEIEKQSELAPLSEQGVNSLVEKSNSCDATTLAGDQVLPKNGLVFTVDDEREETDNSVRLKAKLNKRRPQSSVIAAANCRLPDIATGASKTKIRQLVVSNRGLKTNDVANPKTGRRSNTMSVFPCSVCGKVFRQRRYLHKHAETHGAAHACEVCGKTYRSRAYLRLHGRRHATPETSSRPRFACSECDFSSDVAAAIHAHRQVHAPSNSVRCAICGGAYADRASLSKHRRVHDTARPFACPLPGCAWRFRTDVMCRAHVRAHTIAGRFNCAICGYVFRRKHHLQRHEIRMHADSNLSPVRPDSVTSQYLSTSRLSTNTTAVASHVSTRAVSLTTSRSLADSHSKLHGKSTHVTAVAVGKLSSETLAAKRDIMLSTIVKDRDCVLPPSVSVVAYNHLEDDDCNFTALLDMSDVEPDKKTGHLIVDDFELFR